MLFSGFPGLLAQAAGKFGTGFEAYHLLGRDFDFLACLRVAAGARASLGYTEGAKAHQRHTVTFFQGSVHGGGESIQGFLAVGLAEA